MRYVVLVLLAASAACGGSTTLQDAPDASAAHCDRASRLGARWVTYESLSGNCGPLASQLEPNGSESIGTACTELSAAWSEDDCTLTAKMDCGQWVTTSTTTANADGSVVTGTATYTVTPPSACMGTYAVTATRR